MLKRLLFSSRQAFLLPKTTWITTRDPSVRGADIRMWEKCRPGSSWIPAGDAEMFICHIRDTFIPVFTSYPTEKGVFFKSPHFLVMAVFHPCQYKQHIIRRISKFTCKKHDRYMVVLQNFGFFINLGASQLTKNPISIDKKNIYALISKHLCFAFKTYMF